MSDIEPTWEMTDQQLAEYLGVDISVMAQITPQLRASYERMAWVEQELLAERKPPGVLVCED